MYRTQRDFFHTNILNNQLDIFTFPYSFIHYLTEVKVTLQRMQQQPVGLSFLFFSSLAFDDMRTCYKSILGFYWLPMHILQVSS